MNQDAFHKSRKKAVVTRTFFFLHNTGSTANW
jgi:hypothetical protein